ncbi:CLUMA_CG003081, isoform A [Clunio marinus]|uniref:CLUMA_CG003081, isoform A n=1 Tax=Clunio marinus TaxID=568069 RepID=A0A1J1HP64_9DIPT|nr:CLUMA_CG003081, isoform A [Clunio marinus]
MTEENAKCINIISRYAVHCIVYDNVHSCRRAFCNFHAQVESQKEKEAKKIVISLGNHVMANHIKNYFLLIQPPAC